MDWAPLWNKKRKSSEQYAVWKQPAGYEPYTTTVSAHKLKMIGLKLQKYAAGPRKRLKHRVDPAWWEVLKADALIFGWFGPK